MNGFAGIDFTTADLDGYHTASQAIGRTGVTSFVATIPTEHPIVAVHATSTGAILVGELRFTPAVGDVRAEPAEGRYRLRADIGRQSFSD